VHVPNYLKMLNYCRCYIPFSLSRVVQTW